MDKKSKSLLIYPLFIGTVFVVNSIIKITLHPAKVNDPIYYRSIGCIAILFLLGYVLYVWKSDLPELLKRFLRAIPFAIIFSIFFKISGFGNFYSIVLGIVLCLYLLFKASNWKIHFLIILIPAFLLIVLFKFFFTPFVESRGTPSGTSLLTTKTALLFSGFVLLCSFPGIYLTKLEETETPDLKAISIRSIKFNIVVILLFVGTLFLDDIGNQHNFGLPIQLSLNSVLAILFLVIAYKWGLLPIERKKKSKTKSRIDEIRNELNEFYLEERAKVKGKIKE